MVNGIYESKTKDELIDEINYIQSRLDEAEETLTAIQNGEIDAIITPNGSEKPKVYTLESADTLYRNLVQEMSQGVATLSYDGSILYGNAQLANLLTIPLEKIIGEKFINFIHSEDLEAFKTILNKGIKNKTSDEIRIRSYDGDVIHVVISINTLKDLNGVYAIITDLSEQKRREKLKKNLVELERSNYEFQQFAYVASHDLREPLRMITSFLQLLEKRYKDQLDQDANEFIDFAVDGAKRLNDMINDLLEYSKVTRKEIEPEKVDLELILKETILTLKLSIDENNAEIFYNNLPYICGNEKLLILLFQNLISNSIKYRRKQSPKIYIDATKESDHYLITLKDNGIGIAPEHLGQIFTIFQRLHTKDEYEGTGIGLAIVEKIVQQHGGNIWVKSQLGKGTKFYITIPIHN